MMMAVMAPSLLRARVPVQVRVRDCVRVLEPACSGPTFRLLGHGKTYSYSCYYYYSTTTTTTTTTPTSTSTSPSRPKLPTVPTCPPPSCGCASTTTTTTTTAATTPPPLPALDIDRVQSLRDTVAPYSQHVVIATGRRDWTSRIEDDGIGTGWGELGRGLKRMMSRREGGEFVDPYNRVLVTNSSFVPAKPAPGSVGERTASALLLPSFTYFAGLSTQPASLSSFIRTFLLPKEEDLHQMHDMTPEPTRKRMIRDKDPNVRKSFEPHQIATPVVLICGHGGRDQRCGIMGPLLEEAFRSAFRKENFTVAEAGGLATEEEGLGCSSDGLAASVGLISHIGGHKFAGNVILYLPPGHELRDGEAGKENRLAGKGIWYGRVEPRHVQGIIEETVMNGRIIEDLFRGGVGADGKALRLG